MEYLNITEAIFVRRLNRFVAEVIINGVAERVHIKNTGRCAELLVKGNRVFLEGSDNSARKTRYDLVAVIRQDGRMVNMDSTAPNRMAEEWLRGGGLGPLEDLKSEVTAGDSRFDFAAKQCGRPVYIEVKGCTLEQGGVARFPDAPTERGVKHLKGLTQAVQDGYGGYVLFVIQMSDVKYLHPNDATDPHFGAALREAAASGVTVMAVDCEITTDSMTIGKEVPVVL